MRLFLALTLILAASTADAGTIFQFFQADVSDNVTAVDLGGTTKLFTTGNADGAGVSIPVIVTGQGIVSGTKAYETFVGVHSVNTASLNGNVIEQAFVGSIEFTSLPGGAGTNYLTATFSDIGLTGFAGPLLGRAGTLSSAQPPDSLTFSSDVITILGPDTSMGIGFSNLSPFLDTSGGSIASFSAQNVGTFGAVVGEPTSVALLGISIAIATLCYMRRRSTIETCAG